MNPRDMKARKSPVPAKRIISVTVNEDVIARALRTYLNMPNGDFSGSLHERPDGEYEFVQGEDFDLIPNEGGVA